MKEPARYPAYVLVSTWSFLPVSGWFIFRVAGLGNAWWAWAAFVSACVGVGAFLSSPWSLEHDGQSLVVRRVWRGPETFALSQLTWTIGRPSIFNHLIDADSITSSDGRSFFVFSSSLRNYDELRAVLKVPPA